jgi:hypothetical protein
MHPFAGCVCAEPILVFLYAAVTNTTNNTHSNSQVNDVEVVWDLEPDGVHRRPEGLTLGVLADLLHNLDDLVLRYTFTVYMIAN